MRINIKNSLYIIFSFFFLKILFNANVHSREAILQPPVPQGSPQESYLNSSAKQQEQPNKKVSTTSSKKNELPLSSVTEQKDSGQKRPINLEEKRIKDLKELIANRARTKKASRQTLIKELNFWAGNSLNEVKILTSKSDVLARANKLRADMALFQKNIDNYKGLRALSKEHSLIVTDKSLGKESLYSAYRNSRKNYQYNKNQLANTKIEYDKLLKENGLTGNIVKDYDPGFKYKKTINVNQYNIKSEDRLFRDILKKQIDFKLAEKKFFGKFHGFTNDQLKDFKKTYLESGNKFLTEEVVGKNKISIENLENNRTFKKHILEPARMQMQRFLAIQQAHQNLINTKVSIENVIRSRPDLTKKDINSLKKKIKNLENIINIKEGKPHFLQKALKNEFRLNLSEIQARLDPENKTREIQNQSKTDRAKANVDRQFYEYEKKLHEVRKSIIKTETAKNYKEFTKEKTNLLNKYIELKNLISSSSPTNEKVIQRTRIAFAHLHPHFKNINKFDVTSIENADKKSKENVFQEKQKKAFQNNKAAQSRKLLITDVALYNNVQEQISFVENRKRAIKPGNIFINQVSNNPEITRKIEMTKLFITDNISQATSADKKAGHDFNILREHAELQRQKKAWQKSLNFNGFNSIEKKMIETQIAILDSRMENRLDTLSKKSGWDKSQLKEMATISEAIFERKIDSNLKDKLGLFGKNPFNYANKMQRRLNNIKETTLRDLNLNNPNYGNQHKHKKTFNAKIKYVNDNLRAQSDLLELRRELLNNQEKLGKENLNKLLATIKENMATLNRNIEVASMSPEEAQKAKEQRPGQKSQKLTLVPKTIVEKSTLPPKTQVKAQQSKSIPPIPLVPLSTQYDAAKELKIVLDSYTKKEGPQKDLNQAIDKLSKEIQEKHELKNVNKKSQQLKNIQSYGKLTLPEYKELLQKNLNAINSYRNMREHLISFGDRHPSLNKQLRKGNDKTLYDLQFEMERLKKQRNQLLIGQLMKNLEKNIEIKNKKMTRSEYSKIMAEFFEKNPGVKQYLKNNKLQNNFISTLNNVFSPNKNKIQIKNYELMINYLKETSKNLKVAAPTEKAPKGIGVPALENRGIDSSLSRKGNVKSPTGPPPKSTNVRRAVIGR